MKNKHSIWQGFNVEPEGVLLNQYISLDGDMGVAYERSHSYYKDFHTHDRHILVFPRSSCSMAVRTRPHNETFEINVAHCLMVPLEVEHDDEGISAIYDTFALLPSNKLIQEVMNKVGVQRPSEDFFAKTRLLDRSDWLNRLIEQYFFEKIIAKRLGDDSLKFFEEHILIELFRISCGASTGLETTTPSEQLDHTTSDPIVARALRYIEGNLFDELHLSDIAKKSNSSESTLQRKFKESMACTPMDYVRIRRLTEAAQLLEKKIYSVTEVATMVGYSNPGAFSEAFRAQFGDSPSNYFKKQE